jgi:hypothetical protein
VALKALFIGIDQYSSPLIDEINKHGDEGGFFVSYDGIRRC